MDTKSLAISKQIKNCPNCNSSNISSKYFTQENKKINQSIFCNDCGFKITKIEKNRYQAKKNAIEAWNSSNGKILEKVNNEELKKERDLVKKKFLEVISKKKESKSLKKVSTVVENKVSLNEEKKQKIKYLENLISDFKKKNPKEDCPCTLGDLLRLHNFSLREIEEILSKPFFSKTFLKNFEEVLFYANKGVSIYSKDVNGVIFKYTPLHHFENNTETKLFFENMGLLKNAFILN